MNTATMTPAAEPTLAEVQAELAEIKAKLSKPIKTTTVDDAVKVGVGLWFLGFFFFLLGLVGIFVITGL